MARRFLAAAGGLLLAVGVGAFVAERAGWFDPAGWDDALPGLGAPSTTPPETAAPPEPGDQSTDRSDGRSAGDAAPAPESRRPETAAVRPDRKPAPDAVAPARKPATDSLARDGTLNGPAVGADDAQIAAPETPSDGAEGSSDGAASVGATSAPSDRAETVRPDAGSQLPAGQAGTAPAPAAEETGNGETDAGETDPGETGGQETGAGDTPGVRDPDSGMQLTVPTRDGDAEAPQGAEVAEVPAQQVPSFDIVRVERSGEAVIAGRAAPRSRVTVLQDGQPIATAEANDRGEFVAIPHRPLPPGQRQLTLRAADPESGDTSESDRAVVIDIPRMPEDDTAPSAAASRTAEVPDDTDERGAQVATRGDRNADGQSGQAGQSGQDGQSGPAGQSGTAGPETTGRSANAEQARDPVAVRDNRPTAEPPLLADRSDAAESASDTAPGSGARGQGDALTVPAPPDGGADDAAPAARVTDVPEPAGDGAEVSSNTGQTGDTGGARVTTRQERTGAGEGDDDGRVATRAMRPQARAPRQGAGGGLSDSPSSGGGDAPIAVLVPREGTGEVEVLQRPSGETGLADSELMLEAVQYTVDGGISISGRAPAQARVVAYLNERELARTRAPADGGWTMAPDADVPPGLHTLRVDQLGPDGQVRASVSTPFANQPMVDDLDDNEGMVVIQPGDNLWTIARRTYGQGWEYTLIYRANRDQIRDPDLIYPGQVFVVPEEQRRDRGGGE